MMTAESFAMLAQQHRNGAPGFTMQEYLKGDTLVHPYYDFDDKHDVEPTDEAKDALLVEFKGLVQTLHPGCNIVYAQRNGPIAGGKYKVSYRAWVLGVKIAVGDIPRHVRAIMCTQGLPPRLDLSVYKAKEQLLGVIHGCKDIDVVKRYLKPLDESISLESFLAQNVKEDDKMLAVGGDKKRTNSTLASAVPSAVKRSKKAGNVDPTTASSSSSSSAPSDGGSASAPTSWAAVPGDHQEILRLASDFFGEKYRMRENLTKILINDDNTCILFPTVETWCYIKKSSHASNHQSVAMSSTGCRFKCTDIECQNAQGAPDTLILFRDLPVALRDFFESLVRPAEPVDDTIMEAAKEDCQKHIVANYPQERNLDITPVAQTLIAMARFTKCANCQSTTRFRHTYEGLSVHCERCIWQFPGNGSVISPPQEMYPKLYQMFKIIVNTTNNITNINISGEADLLDGHFNDIQPIFEDQELNQKMFQSFTGHSFDLGRVIHHLGRSRLGLTSISESELWWVWDEERLLWVKSKRKAEYYIADVISQYYVEAQRWFKENTTDPQLAKIRDVKLGNIIKKFKDREKGTLLHDAATHFNEKEELFENRLDANKELLGFEGWVYDLSNDEYRPARPEDHVTMSCGYRLPEVDLQVRSEIMDFVRSIQSTEEDLEYLLMFLASSLDGFNRDEVFHCFKGAGRNGKSALADLMSYVLGGNPDDDRGTAGYYHVISSTMLTFPRPSSASPVPDILHLKSKRLVITSEPERNQKLNSEFIKFLTGNDAISGRWCHQNEDVRFLPQHSLVILANHLPAIDDDEAVWLRSRVVDFPHKFVHNPTHSHERQIDTGLKHRMRHWGPQFMLILLDYYKRYREIGSLQPTANVLRATNEVRDDNDLHKQFIEENLVVTGNAGDRIHQSQLYREFSVWVFKRDRTINVTQSMKTALKVKLSAIMGVTYLNSTRIATASPSPGFRGVIFIDEAEG